MEPMNMPEQKKSAEKSEDKKELDCCDDESCSGDWGSCCSDKRDSGSSKWVACALWVIAGILLVCLICGLVIFCKVGLRSKAFYSQQKTDSVSAQEFGAQGTAEQVDENAIQAVFLTNDQVYFGHITSIDAFGLTLEDVFYLQVDEQLEQDAANGTVEAGDGVSLVKLGTGELHSPQDMMVLTREHVLFWENLRPDSKVTAAIQAFKPEVDLPTKQQGEDLKTNANSNTNASTNEAPVEDAVIENSNTNSAQ